MWVGTFNCHHAHPLFHAKQVFDWHHMVVFPRTSVALTMDGRSQLAGSPNVVVFYNNRTEYERSKLTQEGDRCEYFQFSPLLLHEILASFDQTAQERNHTPFLFTHAFVSRQNFIRQRQLLEQLEQPDVSRLKIDEMAIELLESIVADSFAQRGVKPHVKASTQSTHRQITFEAQKLLLTRFNEPLTLQGVAKSLYVSPYHLSRVFRQQVGRPLYKFLEDIRMRNAFERLADYPNDLNRLALDVGYANHSHFTAAFRKNFGFAPSRWKKSRFPINF
ncbi:MAG: helix-turn-helix transcriptional regulator [Anaerolineae bacterium]